MFQSTLSVLTILLNKSFAIYNNFIALHTVHRDDTSLAQFVLFTNDGFPFIGLQN